MTILRLEKIRLNKNDKHRVLNFIDNSLHYDHINFVHIGKNGDQGVFVSVNYSNCDKQTFRTFNNKSEMLGFMHACQVYKIKIKEP